MRTAWINFSTCVWQRNRKVFVYNLEVSVVCFKILACKKDQHGPRIYQVTLYRADISGSRRKGQKNVSKPKKHIFNVAAWMTGRFDSVPSFVLDRGTKIRDTGPQIWCLQNLQNTNKRLASILKQWYLNYLVILLLKCVLFVRWRAGIVRKYFHIHCACALCSWAGARICAQNSRMESSRKTSACERIFPPFLTAEADESLVEGGHLY